MLEWIKLFLYNSDVSYAYTAIKNKQNNEIKNMHVTVSWSRFIVQNVVGLS